MNTIVEIIFNLPDNSSLLDLKLIQKHFNKSDEINKYHIALVKNKNKSEYVIKVVE